MPLRPRVPILSSLVAVIAAAQRALAKPAGTAFATEESAMRRWLAGDLPSARGPDAAQMTIVARGMTEAVKRAQRAAARLRRAWQDASKQELARRAARDGNAEGKRWKGVGMEEWKWAVGQRSCPWRWGSRYQNICTTFIIP